MKTKQIILASLLFTGTQTTIFAQKTSRETVTKEVKESPSYAMKDVKTINYKIYAPEGFGYPLKTNNYQLVCPMFSDLDMGRKITDSKMYSYNTFQFVPESADLNIEVAFGDEVAGNKKLTAPEKGYPYYMQSFKLPTSVKITDKEGNLIDAFEVSPGVAPVQLGSELLSYKFKMEGGEKERSLFINMNYKKKAKLDAELAVRGAMLARTKAGIQQINKVNHQIYNNIYFIDRKDKFYISSGKGKAGDYTKLDNAQSKAVEAIESGNYTNLNECISVWKSHLEQMKPLDPKAFITKKIGAGLNGNIAVALMYQEKFDEAQKYCGQYLALARDLNARMTFKDFPKSQELMATIKRRKKQKENNANLSSIPTIEAQNFKAGIRTSVLNFDTYNAVRKEKKYEEFKNAIVVEKEETVASEFNNKYINQAVITKAQGATLYLNAFANRDLVGKPLPSDVFGIPDIRQFGAISMKLTELPTNMGSMTKVEKLSLSGNQFKSVPNSIGKLEKLEKLDLRNNQLTSLPEEIKNCKNLKSLKLKGNNFSKAEQEKILSWVPAKCKVKF